MKNFTVLKKMLFVIGISCMASSINAQEESKLTVTPSADIVSNYVWRGVYQTGAAIQPSLTFGYGGFSLGAWGSTDFSTTAKEFDLSLGYQAGGFSIMATDYWWAGEGAKYGDYSSNHYLEGSVGYSFGEDCPLSITWSTMLGFDGDKDASGDQQFSTFVELGYDVNVDGVLFTPSIGVSPWTGMYHKAGTDGFALCTVSLKASKEVEITDKFSLPIFGQVVIAPNQDNVFLVFGVSL